jgi:hypothetical protein
VEEPDRDSEAAGDAQETRFLPPEPAGPEPELSDPPPHPPPPLPPPPQTYGYPPPPPGGPQPPGAAQPAGAGQPPGGAQPPPGYGSQPAPGYPPPPGYAPPGYPPPAYGAPPAWGYPPQPRVADNGQAVAGFVFSLVAVGLLVISFGLSSIVSLGCAITGVVCSRNGKRKVESGETPKHHGLAQAGFIIGWVGIALSVLATAGWILAIALGAIDETGGSDPQGFELSLALLDGS